MDPATRVLLWLLGTAAICFGLGLWCGATAAMRSWSSTLVNRVREIMNTDLRFALNGAEAARELRTLLAIDGHRLPKHVRDAANVWLAERDAEDPR